MFACCIKHSLDANDQSVPRTKEIWRGKMDFFVTVMGFNIGLGNILRFPYLCMKNGGGAFLIPYAFFLATIGIPLFLLEMSLAQYSGYTPLEFYQNLCPLFKGIGWCNVISCFVYNIYYNVILAWIIYYIIYSFFQPLPWSNCNNTWNTKLCIKKIEHSNISSTILCSNNYHYASPSEEFWEREVLKLSKGIHEIGNANYMTFICLLIGWLLVFIGVFKGIKSLGRVVYVTALTPYILIVILLIRGVTLKGSLEGIKFYLYPELHYLTKVKTWMEAGQQIFWSLAPGWGITICLASHNRFKHNIYRDSILLPLVSAFTSFLSGFVIFSFMGNIALRYKTPLKCAFKTGPGLAFEVYPDALLLLPISWLWSLIFFLLLLMLGVDSSFTSFECVFDSLKHNYRLNIRKDMIMKICLICVLILLAIPFITNGGYYLYQVIDYYQVAFLPLVVLTEIMVICYIYGVENVKQNILIMTGHKIGDMWTFDWKYLLPAELLALFFCSLATQGNLKYGDYSYPFGAAVVGWTLSILIALPIPVYIIYKLFIIKYQNPDYGKLTAQKIKFNLKYTLLWEEDTLGISHAMTTTTNQVESIRTSAI